MSDSRTWFITGCSTGIGRALAEGLIEAGQRVVVTARNLAQVEDLACDHVLALPIDITDEESIAAAVAAAIARFGHIDVLVNNAAIGLIAAVEESTAQEVEQMFRTNVLGTLAVLRHVLPGMRARRGGYVMTIGSIGSFRSQPALGIYGGVKHALAGIHEALTDEVKPLGIRATLLALGSYRTGFRHRGMKHGEVVIDDYDSTSGAVRRRLKGDYPAVMGDPASVTPVLLSLADMDDPPRRLAVGADALAGMRARLKVMEEELDQWEALSQSAGVRPQDVAALQGSTGLSPR